MRFGRVVGNVTLAAFGVAALLVLSPLGHVIAVIAMISVIGIPLYFVLLAIPSLFLILLALRAVAEAWRFYRAGRTLPALVLALALLAMADFFVFRAWRVNWRLSSQAAALAAGDIDSLGAPAPIATLAVLRNTRERNDAANPCDDLCQRLLLTGAAQEVLELTAAPAPLQPHTSQHTDTRSPWPQFEPTESMSGTAWRLERRDACPASDGLRAARPLNVAEPRRPAGTPRAPQIDPERLMRLKIASGACLIGEAKTLAAADALVAYGRIRSGRSDYGAGFDAWADTISAWRMTFSRRRDGALVEQFRRTGVWWLVPPWFFAPVIISGYEFNMANGWFRDSKRLHRSRHESEPPLGAFLTERLGLDLVPRVDVASGATANSSPQADLRAEQAKVVDRILSQSAAPSKLEAKLLNDYLATIGAMARTKDAGVGPDDWRRLLRIIQDSRIDLPQETVNAIRRAVDADTAPSLAGALFARLATPPPPTPDGDAGASWKVQLRIIAASLAELPSEAVRPYRAQTLALMRDRDRRMFATRYLGRLEAFGPNIAPEIIAMMDDAFSLRGARGAEAGLRSSWDDVWRAGARSMCRLAPDIPDRLNEMRARTNALAENKMKFADDVAAAALLRMGATEEDVRSAFNIDPGDEKAMRAFGFILRRARGALACQ